MAVEKWEAEEKKNQNPAYEQHDSWYLIENSVNSCKN